MVRLTVEDERPVRRNHLSESLPQIGYLAVRISWISSLHEQGVSLVGLQWNRASVIPR